MNIKCFTVPEEIIQLMIGKTIKFIDISGPIRVGFMDETTIEFNSNIVLLPYKTIILK